MPGPSGTSTGTSSLPNVPWNMRCRGPVSALRCNAALPREGLGTWLGAPESMDRWWSGAAHPCSTPDNTALRRLCMRQVLRCLHCKVGSLQALLGCIAQRETTEPGRQSIHWETIFLPFLLPPPPLSLFSTHATAASFCLIVLSFSI